MTEEQAANRIRLAAIKTIDTTGKMSIATMRRIVGSLNVQCSKDGSTWQCTIEKADSKESPQMSATVNEETGSVSVLDQANLTALLKS